MNKKWFVIFALTSGVLLLGAGCNRVEKIERRGPPPQANVAPKGGPSLRGEAPNAVKAPVLADVPSDAKPLVDGAYVIDASSSTATWEGRRNFLADYRDYGTIGFASGTFSLVKGNVTGTIVFDTTTIHVEGTGHGAAATGMLQRHLSSPDFFDAQKYPAATFVITSVVPDTSASSSNRYLITGQLTVKETTASITFPAEAYIQNGVLHVKAGTLVDRTKWNLRYGSNKFFDNLADQVIDDNFSIVFDIVAKPNKK